MTTTSYIARDIDLVVQCVNRLFQNSESDRQTFARKILESNGAYDPSVLYEGYNAFSKLAPEDRCLVARHIQEGDSINRGFFTLVSHVPDVYQLHIAAVKEEWNRVKGDEEDPMCECCGCDPNMEDHLGDCDVVEGWHEEKERNYTQKKICRYCDGEDEEHRRDCDLVKSDRM